MPEGLLHEELVQVPHCWLAVGLGPFAVKVRPMPAVCMAIHQVDHTILQVKLPFSSNQVEGYADKTRYGTNSHHGEVRRALQF